MGAGGGGGGGGVGGGGGGGGGRGGWEACLTVSAVDRPQHGELTMAVHGNPVRLNDDSTPRSVEIMRETPTGIFFQILCGLLSSLVAPLIHKPSVSVSPIHRTKRHCSHKLSN